MKKTISLCLATLLALGCSASAQADWGRHDNHRSYERHYNNNNNGYRSRSSWVGPAAILAITGLAIGAAAYNSRAYAAPAPIYVAPPPPRPIQVAPDNGSWYYCGSSGQYYPYVRYCDEGWQQVMPPR